MHLFDGHGKLMEKWAETSTKLSHLRSRLVQGEGQTQPVWSCKGALEIRDLAFTHSTMPLPLYEKLSFAVQSGCVVLVKGRNGAGKTTFMRLLLGLLEPDRGQILADGIDLRQLSPHW